MKASKDTATIEQRKQMRDDWYPREAAEPLFNKLFDDWDNGAKLPLSASYAWEIPGETARISMRIERL